MASTSSVTSRDDASLEYGLNLLLRYATAPFKFESEWQNETPIYFYHTVDRKAATSNIQVLGPSSLNFTFFYSKPSGESDERLLAEALERKTVGFLTLVRPGDASKKIVLVWAQSGHDCGKNGDTLLVTKGVLDNKLWTLRAHQLGEVLGIKMGSPYDSMGSKDPEANQANRGIYAASHVEKKLATHAVYLFLSIFKIPHVSGKLSIETLRQLQAARWEDASAPRFEIFISRENCPICFQFTSRLAELTGVVMDIWWHDRLKNYDYPGNCAAKRKVEVITIRDDYDDDTPSRAPHQEPRSKRPPLPLAPPRAKPLPPTAETEAPLWL